MVKLSRKEYHDLRVLIYSAQMESCDSCNRWCEMDQFQLHHIKTRGAGGGDEMSNLVGLCWQCHRKTHDGN